MTWQNRQSECALSEDSDQPGHPPSLIRVFVVHMKNAWVLSYPLSAHRRLRSAWASAQSDQSLRCPHEECLGPQVLRAFAVRMKNAWVLRYPLSALRRLWSDWADAQADLSLRWAHTHFVGFVMSRLKLNFILSQCARDKSFFARKPEVHSIFLVVKNFSKM